MVGLLFVTSIYAAAAVCLMGVTWRVWRWASTPEPFAIPTTCGQQRSLAWIAPGRLESPSSVVGVTIRVLLEALLFRSLFRNTTHKRTSAGAVAAAANDTSARWPRLAFIERKGLWLGALAFHWSLLVVVLRHLRLFVDPIPGLIARLTAADGFFQIGAPVWYVSDGILVVALTYLLLRRLRDPLLRYVTLPADYLALGVLIAVAVTGLVTRYLARPDLVAVKLFTLSLAAFTPGDPGALSPWVVVHLLCVLLLVVTFPFSKLMHAAGIWLSPTRNQRTDSRRHRHINPWNAPVPVHGYREWEAEFHDKLVAAGLKDRI